MDIVIDASVTMAWCFEDEATPGADAALDLLRESRAVVPTIWSLEVANVLLGAQRRQRISEAQVTRFVTSALDEGVSELIDPYRELGIK